MSTEFFTTNCALMSFEADTTPVNKEDHNLSDTRHEKIRAGHKADFIDIHPEAKQPKIIILAGQPGAGKSKLPAQALQHFSENDPLS